MKRFITIIAALASVCFAASAQYRDFTYDTPSIAKLVQIDDYEDGTLFLFTINSGDSERLRFVVNDNIRIAVDGEYKKYKLLSVAQVPLTSQNTVAYLRDKGQELNFAMQFEKVPLDKTFSIIEDPAKSSSLTFNFTGIKINTDAVSRKVPLEDFLSATDYVTSGLYNQDGKSYMYYDVNGLTVATYLEEEYFGFTRAGKLRIVVTNDSGKGVSVSAANITVTATKNEKKGFISVPLWDLATYDSYVRSNNASAVSNYGENINPVASSVSQYRQRNVKPDDLGGQLLLGSLEMLFRSASREEVDRYADALEQNRKRLWNNYLQSLTLENGQSYGGFVSFKDSSYKKYIITVSIGGNSYIFHING